MNFLTNQTYSHFSGYRLGIWPIQIKTQICRAPLCLHIAPHYRQRHLPKLNRHGGHRLFLRYFHFHQRLQNYSEYRITAWILISLNFFWSSGNYFFPVFPPPSSILIFASITGVSSLATSNQGWPRSQPDSSVPLPSASCLPQEALANILSWSGAHLNHQLCKTG